MSDSRSELCPHVRVVERNGSGTDRNGPNHSNGNRDVVQPGLSRGRAREAHAHEAAAKTAELPCPFCIGDRAHNPNCPMVGVKAGGGDDAIHSASATAPLTLCHQDAASRNTTTKSADVDCWTCRWELKRRA